MKPICIVALATVMICISGCGPEAKKPTARPRNSIEAEIGTEAYEATIKLMNFNYQNNKVGRDTGPDVVRKLISEGALVNSKGDGWTSLSRAAKYSSTEIVTLLIEAGANVNAKNDDNTFPLMLAKTPEVVTLLIEAGADVNARADMGITTLMLAVVEFGGLQATLDWTPEMVTLLIEAGADVNAKGRFGYTPLMVAANFSSPERVTLLIEAGADVNVRCNEGKTPLMFARSAEIKQLLIDAGAKE